MTTADAIVWLNNELQITILDLLNNTGPIPWKGELPKYALANPHEFGYLYKTGESSTYQEFLT